MSDAEELDNSHVVSIMSLISSYKPSVYYMQIGRSKALWYTQENN